MKIADWIQDSSLTLANRGIETARLDCLVLLEDLFKKDKAWIITHDDEYLADADVHKLNRLISERSRHIPLAVLRGKSNFYRREFLVDSNTLIPRPESEEVIKQTLKYAPHQSIIDIGTGSGCLAISAAIELGNTPVCAVDISEHSLRVAQKNNQRHKTKVLFKKGSLLDEITEIELQNSTILANLPYVPNGIEINKEAEHEPPIAIFGGRDGLIFYRKLFNQVRERVSKPRIIITESLLFQHKELEFIARDNDYRLIDSSGLIQVFEFMAQPQE